MVCGFPYLQSVLNEILGSLQYTAGTDTSVQMVDLAFSTVPLTVLAVSTSKQLVPFQARPIQKRIRPFNVGICLEAWPLDLAEFKQVRTAAVAFLTLAWGLPFHCSALLLSARVNIASIPGF